MKPVIETAIDDVLQERFDLTSASYVVEHPSELAHGDYTCNVALSIAKELKQSPHAIATEIASALHDQIEYVSHIEVAGPGFLNFYLSQDFFSTEVSRACVQDESWGGNLEWKGKKVLVEYTDPNPFKAFHIGHLFTNIVGESIARLAMMQGADTKRLNYQGDVGLHVAHALYGMQKLGIKAGNSLTADDLGKAYAYGAKAYKDDEQAKQEITILNTLIYERTDEEVNELYDAGRAVSLAYFEEIYALLGTTFDSYFFESEAGPLGKRLVLDHPEVFIKSDGALVFEGEQYGLHTRVFLNSQGLPTYEAKELALAKLKEDRLGAYDHSIVSTAREISEYFKVLKMAMSFVYPELSAKTEHIGHGMVRLTTGKMSSRTGDVIPAMDFISDIAKEASARIEENGITSTSSELAHTIALGAIRYATLKGSILQDSVFDSTKALSFEGDSGPYLQYTHARICSVRQKAEAIGLTASLSTPPAETYEVERLIYRFPEVIEEAWNERAPHKVVGFLTELAGAFNTLYAHEKIADSEDEHAPYKLAVAEAVGLTLKNGLWVLGIEAPERM